MEHSILIDKLLKGSLVGMLRVGLAIPLYLFLTPFTLSKLGTDMFAIWSFSTIMISLVNLTDFGFKNSLVRYVAGNIDNHEEINRHFRAALWLYTAMSILIFILTVIFADLMVSRLLHLHKNYHSVGVFVLIVSAASFSIRFLATPFQAVIEGHQDHYYSQFVSLLWLVANFAFTIAALMISSDVRILGMVSVAANLLFPLLFIYRVHKRFLFIKMGFGRIDKHALGNLLKFGVGIQMATILITLREPIYKVVISRTYGLESLASFDIAYRLCTQLSSIVITPLLGTFAASALLYNRNGDIGKILKPMVGFTLVVFIPSVLFFGSFSTQLISVWLGRQADETAFMVFLMFAAFALYYSTEPIYKSIEGSGLSTYSAVVQFISLSSCIAAFEFLSLFGSVAIPTSLLFGFSLFSSLNYFMFRRRYKGVSLFMPRQLLILLAPACCYSILTLWVSRAWLPVVFSSYLCIHLLVAQRVNVLDVKGIISRILSTFQRSVRSLKKDIRVVSQ